MFQEGKGEPWPRLSPESMEDHRAKRLVGLEAHVFRLSTTIVAKTASITRIIYSTFEGKRLRIYPPFPADVKAEDRAAFEQAWIPSGAEATDRYIRVKPHSTTGISHAQGVGLETFYCEGLRLDFEPGTNYPKFIQILLENLCQHTHQWWLRGRMQPFRGISRFGFEMNLDYTPRDPLKYEGAASVEETWYSTADSQVPLGLEKPVTAAVWERCCADALKGMRGDAGILSFHDAISYFMAEDDTLFIISLTIAVEIIGNKRRILLGKKPTAFAEILRASDLVDGKNRTALARLFIDRGHVAHGRKPRHFSPGAQQQAEEYIGAVQLMLVRYLEGIPPQKWPVASQLGIDRNSKINSNEA